MANASEEVTEIFEFHQLPSDKADTTWMQSWMQQMKPKFHKMQLEVGGQEDLINDIGALFRESSEICQKDVEYLWLSRDDDAFRGLSFVPWINAEDQFVFYITSQCLLPRARIAVRHFEENVQCGEETMKLEGFRILLQQDDTKWAIYAVLLANNYSMARFFLQFSKPEVFKYQRKLIAEMIIEQKQTLQLLKDNFEQSKTLRALFEDKPNTWNSFSLLLKPIPKEMDDKKKIEFHEKILQFLQAKARAVQLSIDRNRFPEIWAGQHYTEMSISDDLQKLFPVKGKAVIESIASRLQVQESGNNRTYEPKWISLPPAKEYPKPENNSDSKTEDGKPRKRKQPKMSMKESSLPVLQTTERAPMKPAIRRLKTLERFAQVVIASKAEKYLDDIEELEDLGCFVRPAELPLLKQLVEDKRQTETEEDSPSESDKPLFNADTSDSEDEGPPRKIKKPVQPRLVTETGSPSPTDIGARLAKIAETSASQLPPIAGTSGLKTPKNSQDTPERDIANKQLQSMRKQLGNIIHAKSPNATKSSA